jgi:hypothetical protein
MAPTPPTAIVPNAMNEAVSEAPAPPPFAEILAIRNAGIHVQTAYSSHMWPK